jgi:hypothetical protein
MCRLSTQSTSTTDIVAAAPGKIAFSSMAITSGIHRTLIEKSYPWIPDVCSSALVGFGERILERIEREVTLVLLEAGFNPRIDWDSRVFGPIIATFDIVEELGVCPEDSEYMLLLVTALLLAFELLLLAGRDKAKRTRIFLVRAFEDIFVEPEICRTVGDVLDIERARLARMNADIKVLKAIQGVRVLLPAIATCTAAWDALMLHRLRGNERDHYLQRMHTSTPLEPEVRISMCSEDAATKFLREAEIFAPLRRLAANPFDVEINVFLRHGCGWDIDFGTSIDLEKDRARINTFTGLSIKLEAGCLVSPITAPDNTMLVTMPERSVSGFTGTISIPPGCSYCVDKVEALRERGSGAKCTLIETADSVLEIGEGDYSIKRVSGGTHLIVENVRR